MGLILTCLVDNWDELSESGFTGFWAGSITNAILSNPRYKRGLAGENRAVV